MKRTGWFVFIAALLAAQAAWAQAPKLEKTHISLSVGGSISQMNKIAYFVALNRKYFEQEGLEVESVAFASGTAALQNLIGGNADVVEGSFEHTAHDNYGVGFPIAAKAEVRGARQHPFYKWAAAEKPLELPRWNFHKYLIGRDGRIAASFATQVEPTDPRVIAAIEKELSSAA